ncbi:MAG: tryptophan--tRNA ligase [Clostridiales bacterium]|jgi:tryptophanyl-tRNA synthetase|nr:tryptophan--tRNA ligase [Clostridiales bacterium]
MQTILSGVQASGHLTLGNYLGAIKNWRELHKDGRYRCWFFVADLHSITVRQNPAELRERSIEIMTLYLAAGLGQGENSIFFQSHVPQHAELGWVLGCYCNLGELSRMTQFKDKSGKNEAGITSGLFTYPVLMAADILAYQADLVPVGADQKQHLELCRDVAVRFNGIYGETFKIPEPFIPKEGARIMSLQDPSMKMSKSDPNSNGYILLLDKPDTIMKKIKRAVTDSVGEVRFDAENPERAGINNLISIYSAATGKDFEQIAHEFEGKGYGAFKQAAGEAIIDVLAPLQEEYGRLSNDKEYVRSVYTKSAEQAREAAQKTLADVYERIGFIPKEER